MRELIARRVIRLIEHGFVPDAVTRRMIYGLCDHRVRQFSRVSDAEVEKMKAEFVAMQSASPIAESTELANEQHYEVPAEFFVKILGPRLKYSCCSWQNGVTDLADAEYQSLQLTCQRAGLADGMRVLELGCGWGSLTLWIAEHFPNVRITAVSNSNSQRNFIRRRAGELGFDDRVSVLTCDMNEFQTSEKFDRVISIEMFEHMRNYQLLLERIASWLETDGRLFVHIFCHRNQPYVYETEGELNWMGRHFFSGGIMPSEDLLAMHGRNLSIERQWRVSGIDYGRTLDAWLERLDCNRDDVLNLFRDTYGDSNAYRWMMRWRVFLMACSELFRYGGGTEWFVSHYLMKPTSSVQV